MHRTTILVLLIAGLGENATAQELLLAHRGVHQNFPRDDLDPETCTAERIFEPTHRFVENTIPSMAEAFRLGADTVEIDVHATADGHVVVFHDWTLECRTNGEGVTEQKSLAYLRSLDVGYGYTHDGHKTHPFRCRPGDRACLARNRMPTLEEVLVAFPDKSFAVNMKSGSRRALDIILADLQRIREAHGQDLGRLLFYCSRQSILDAARKAIPEMTVPKLGRKAMGKCLAGYFLSGRFAEPCRGGMFALPWEKLESMQPATTRKLVQDIHAIGGQLGVVRVDTPEAYRRVHLLGVDGLWTDRIEIVGRVARPVLDHGTE